MASKEISLTEKIQLEHGDLRPNAGTTVLAGAAGDQFALEESTIANGVFTENLLKLMDQVSKNEQLKNGLTVSELYKQLKIQVENDTQGKQSPVLRTTNDENDFRIW